MSVMIEIEDGVFIRIRRAIGLNQMGFEINLCNSVWDVKVIVVWSAAI